jgi:hypothetical protein
MDTNFYKVSKVCWAVTSEHTAEPMVFACVDDATNYLETVGVKDEEIDFALIDMTAKGNTRANFGVHGCFTYSDGAQLNGAFGVA